MYKNWLNKRQFIEELEFIGKMLKEGNLTENSSLEDANNLVLEYTETPNKAVDSTSQVMKLVSSKTSEIQNKSKSALTQVAQNINQQISAGKDPARVLDTEEAKAKAKLKEVMDEIKGSSSTGVLGKLSGMAMSGLGWVLGKIKSLVMSIIGPLLEKFKTLVMRSLKMTLSVGLPDNMADAFSATIGHIGMMTLGTVIGTIMMGATGVVAGGGIGIAGGLLIMLIERFMRMLFVNINDPNKHTWKDVRFAGISDAGF